MRSIGGGRSRVLETEQPELCFSVWLPLLMGRTELVACLPVIEVGTGCFGRCIELDYQIRQSLSRETMASNCWMRGFSQRCAAPLRRINRPHRNVTRAKPSFIESFRYSPTAPWWCA